MKQITIPYDEKVIVGLDTSDDAGVYQLAKDTAIIQTLDFITPIVDDPYTYGQIAVCNSLSDVYAMGGKPITAMNIVCFPINKFSLDLLTKILKGGLDILKKAGVQLLGGHSVEDEEMKYGVSVTGIIHPERVIKNQGLRDGDLLILTKPLGTGINATAIKAAMTEEDILTPMISSMISLNKTASELMQQYTVHACTDVTGFGLIGHITEMIRDSTLKIIIDSSSIPILPGADANASMGLIPAGMYRNRDYTGELCTIDSQVSRELADIVFDPQTSGGLLIGIPEEDAKLLLTDLHSNGIADSRIIARVEKGNTPGIRVI